MSKIQLQFKEEILFSVKESIRAVSYLQKESAIDFIDKASEQIARVLDQGGLVLSAGNGGSLCDAMHFAEELTGQFRAYRKALPAICLSDPGYLTCAANDFGFDKIFSRGVEAFGGKKDLLLVLTTSGASENIYQALMAAKERSVYTIALLGKEGGKCKGCSDLELIIDGFATSDRIQEAHMSILHIIIEMVEKRLQLDA